MQEKRRARRAYKGLLSYFWYGGMEYKALTVDLSATGAFLSSPTVIPVGAIAYVRIDEKAVASARGIYLMTRVARQVHQNPIVSAVPGIGVEWLVARGHAGRENLTAFLKEHVFADAVGPVADQFVQMPGGPTAFLFDVPMPNEVPALAEALARTMGIEDLAPRVSRPPEAARGFQRRYAVNRPISFQDGDVLHTAVVAEMNATTMLIRCDPPVPRLRTVLAFPYSIVYKGKPFQVIVTGSVESVDEKQSTFEMLISSVDDRGEPALFSRYVQFLEHTRQKPAQAAAASLSKSLPKE